MRSQGGWGEDAITMFREGRQATIENLIKCNHGVGKWLAPDYLPEGMEHDEDDPSRSKLYREILKAAVRYHDVAIRREQGDYSNDPSIIDAAFQPITNQTVAQPLPIGINNRTVSDIIDIYVDECCSTNRWKGRTEVETISTYQLLKRIIGDRPAEHITRADIAEFKKTIMKLPPNMNKMTEYRGKTIPEIVRYVEKNNKPRLSLVTVKKYLMRVNALFGYAEDHSYIASNPAKGISIDVKKADRVKIAPFTDDDLYKLYNCETVKHNKFRYPWQFWLIILAPLTGCRLEEMCQLHLSDVKQEDGIWVLDINQNTSDKTLKSESSARLIPLHPFLIDDLKFIGFVEKLKRYGNTRLFPDLNLQKKGGYGRAVTRWFPKFRESAGVAQIDVKGQKKVFHSFRHTFDTKLKHQYVKTTMIDELMGHSVEKLSMGTYGAEYPVKQKLEDGILKINIKLDMLSHLKKIVNP